MKLDYDGFMMYASMHREDITQDIIKAMGDSWNSGLTLSQEDVTLVTMIAVKATYAILHQYHEWANQRT